MAELKPCPFCGKEPENFIAAERESVVNTIYAKIHCIHCNIEISERTDNYSSFSDIAKIEEKVINRWNNRTNCPECIKED